MAASHFMIPANKAKGKIVVHTCGKWVLFAGCFCRTGFIAQRPRPKGTDLAPRDVESRHTTVNNTTSTIQQPSVQHKVQYTDPTVLTATKNHVHFPRSFLAIPQCLVTWSRVRLFNRTSSRAGGETTPLSYTSIPCSETTRNNRSIKHPHNRAHTCEVYANAQSCSHYFLPTLKHSSFAIHT